MAHNPEVLLQEGAAGQEMTEEEFEQLQAALVASMNQGEEEILIGDEDDEEEESSNPGIVQQMMGMMGLGQNSQNEQPGDEERHDN